MLAPAATTTLRQPEIDHGRRRLAYGAFGLVLVALVIGIALVVRSLLGSGSALVPAPSVVGLDQGEAVVLLAQEGLRVGTITEKFDEKPFGTVLSQSPDQGIVVPPNGAVDLEVSKGIEMTVVPSEVIGLSREEAEIVLRDNKLQVGDVVTRDGLFVPGTVLAVSPVPGQQLRANSGVTLTVASGDVRVPDVRGRTREEAERELQRAGFSVAIELRDSPGEPGRVLDQTSVNQLEQAGSTITVVVSQVPPPPPTPTAAPSSSAPPSPGASGPPPSPAPSPP